MRGLFTSFIAFLLLVICAFINVYGASADSEIQKFSPQVQCDSTLVITAEQALEDFNKGDQQQG
jgi:hypothetical protein